MGEPSFRVEACGDRAFLLRFGDHPHPRLSRRIALLRERLLDARPTGLEDAVAGFVTLLLLYDPDAARASDLSDLAARLLPRDAEAPARTWQVPVCYDEPVAPDLAQVAAAAGLSPQEAAALHAARTYTVYLIGFSPGFPYLGDLDPRLVLPRRADPRPRVPAGSVAIATAYTAIYPQDTAGGWHLIGRTPARLFDPASSPPALLATGDEVRFVPISLAEYERLAHQDCLPRREDER